MGVAFSHLTEVNGLPPYGLQLGAAGVDIFFVISGFIMVHSSTKLFRQAGASRTFVVNRIARIVPLYWSVAALGEILYYS